MQLKRNHLIIFLCLLFFESEAFAQNISELSNGLAQDRLRNEQLQGQTDSSRSFSINNLNVSETATKPSPKISIQLLPFSITQQYNTLAPYGWNDGAMIPAKGYQTLWTAGFKAQYKQLSIQIKPEWVYAANPNFEQFPNTETNPVRLAHINYLNSTDIPARFGTQAYQRLGWGQSSIRYNTSNVSFGLSTENLWWGPGTRNALLMSNTARGFLHFTLNSRKPIKTPIGSFEGQLIAGKLQASGYNNAAEDYTVNGESYELPKTNHWRYLSGLSFSYQPKWIPGLFFGLNRVFQVYRSDMGNTFNDFLPVISPFQKKNTSNEDGKKRDQLASLFMRWVLPESKAEFYFEYGWNDHAMSLWDLYESVEHSRAYLFGFRKLFNLNAAQGSYLKLNIETTQLQQSADRLVRPAGAWYLHWSVRQGYTHRGEVLGAGIGPGSNLQTLDLSIWKKDRVFGFQLERYAHNLDFYYDAYTNYRHKWVDLMLNTYIHRSYGNLGVQAKINTAYLRNYQWQPGNHKINMQFQATLSYQL